MSIRTNEDEFIFIGDGSGAAVHLAEREPARDRAHHI